MYPGHVADVIISVNKNLSYDPHRFFQLAESLGARHALIHVEDDSLGQVAHMVRLMRSSAYRSITIMIDSPDLIVSDDLLSEWVANDRVVHVVIVGQQNDSKKMIDYVPTEWFQRRHEPSPLNMVCSLDYYAETQTWNPSFHRRLFVSAVGSVHSGWCDPEAHARVEDVCDMGSLRRILFNQRFNTLSSAAKSRTDICMSCEFRHICVDGRAPIMRGKIEWYHTTECAYNPYICKWKGEEGYRTLAECGVVSNADGFSIDHERIAAINAELWGE